MINFGDMKIVGNWRANGMKIFFSGVLLAVSFGLMAQSNNDNSSEYTSANDFGYWDLGMNFGMYWPSAYGAHFYDGSSSNVNKISYVFGNKYWYEDIKRNLNATDTVFVKELPRNMRYTPAIQIGLYFRRTFNNYFGISLQFDYSKLTAADKYSVEVDPNQIATLPDIRLFDIWGVEERVNIDILVSRYFKTKNPLLMPFFEAGLNISSTRVKENKIRVGSLEYSLINVYLNNSYTPGVQANKYYIQQGGMGLGASIAAGIRLRFNNKVSVDPGIRFYYQKIKLEGYNLMKPAFSIFVRLSLTDFFSSNE